ncbi:MAG: chemotaxis protein CheW [Gammaproteobacteria bacterium]|nr:chemotaxis protein CheW [Gammaproteobacteria bacterium]MBK9426064.1 chemotaxis protein CheW [Gammaproteobacteria bacterium]
MSDTGERNQKAAEVDGLLLTLANDRLQLLLPLAAVAEVLEDAPLPAQALASQPWLHGWLSWRGREIPLLAYEGIAGGKTMGYQECQRVAIINAVGAAASQGFYGLAIRELPRPLRLSADSGLRALDVEAPRGSALVVEVRGEPALIPDFELLEQLVVSAGLKRN